MEKAREQQQYVYIWKKRWKKTTEKSTLTLKITSVSRLISWYSIYRAKCVDQFTFHKSAFDITQVKDFAFHTKGCSRHVITCTCSCSVEFHQLYFVALFCLFILAFSPGPTGNQSKQKHFCVCVCGGGGDLLDVFCQIRAITLYHFLFTFIWACAGSPCSM